jgi:two-component system CheB/CheR fusion protein
MRRAFPTFTLKSCWLMMRLYSNERLVAVVLTGTGSDGASGAYQVKLAGGLVIIENPDTAAFPGLPASLSITTVDYVADLERIGPLLSEILTKAEMSLPLESRSISAEGEQGAGATAQEDAISPPGARPPQAAAQNQPSLQHVLKLVQEHTNIDFSQYKLPTILRRLQRRLFATNIPDLGAYVQYLASHPEEYPQLVSSFLIKVTEFFRDPELFAALKEWVLPELITEARRQGGELRLWSAGCATGEEAYSLAILVSELLDPELDRFSVKIFVTDVDAGAIEYARRGIYPAAALVGVSEERLARYFHKLDGAYQINKLVRGLVIFGLHDLGVGSPFPRIDLVLCRNVLMYFTRELQARVLQAFAFSVRNGGYLALGTAESISPAAEYFTQASQTLKLYRRVGDRVLFPMPTMESLRAMAMGPPTRRQGIGLAPSTRTSGHTSALRAGKEQTAEQELGLRSAHNSYERLGQVVLGLPAGVVVVDRRYDIQIINVPAMRLLDIFTEPIGQDLIHLARSVPSTSLKQAIDAAFRRELWPPPRQQQMLTAVATFAPTGALEELLASLEGVVTVETLLGERRRRQLRNGMSVREPPGRQASRSASRAAM